MARTIEELISKHFRRNSAGKFTQKEEPGQPIDAQTAARVTASLSAEQRAGIDPDTIEALSALLEEDAAKGGIRYSRDVKSLKAFEWFKNRRSPDLERTWMTLAAIRAALEAKEDVRGEGYLGLTDHYVGRNRYVHAAISEVFELVRKRTLKLDAQQVFATLQCSFCENYRAPGKRAFNYALLEPVIKGLERLRGELKLTGEQSDLLREVRKQYHDDGYGSTSRAAKDMLDEILRESEGQASAPIEVADLLWDKEPWAKQINESVRALPASERDAAMRLLKHAGTNNEYQAKPGKPWFNTAQMVVDELGQERAREIVGSWLKAFAADERKKLADFEAQFHNRPSDRRAVEGPFFRQNTGYIGGVAHIARCIGGSELLGILCDLVEDIAKAAHHVRENSASVAMAAIRTLEASEDPSAAAGLSRLALRVRWPKLRKAAEKSLDELVKRKGISRADAEEEAVPDYGLENGLLRVEIDSEGRAEIAVGRGDRPKLTWHRDGKEPTHIVPKPLKAAHPEEVAAVQATVDEIEKMTAAQRTRIDLLFRREAKWDYPQWQARYLSHGLLGPLARRLIWMIDDVPALYQNDGWQDVRGRPVQPSDSAAVSLWHPAQRSAEEVLAWRQRLAALEITQPIKQAHREVYLLTDAERRTETYSNRFAAHIVKNHATLAISQVRKWKMGMYGSGDSTPTLTLPHFNLVAQWWVQPAGEEHDRLGFPLYLVTDQVRFYRNEVGAEPMRLEDVPPLALTEVMRDVDLFVSIASVGNEPTWQDGGPQGRYREYWQNYSFGELSETARTRRAALEGLLPRLTKIRERCSLADRFLRVRGDRRTYKIHLGSGNILMEPNDQYLCIVPDRAAREGENVFLPFEGDSTLSVILSKAFLLADDTKIKDPTIARQIGH